MTTISSVNQNTNAQRGKSIGATIGAGVGTGYLLKNKKDIFEVAVKDGIQKLVDVGVSHPKQKVIAIAIGVSALAMGAVTGAGALIGAGVGKIVDKINEKKQKEQELKQVLAQVLQDKVKDIEPMSVEELENTMNGVNA